MMINRCRPETFAERKTLHMFLQMAEERKDRKTQAKVINELVRIEEEQLNIMNQLQFVKEQRCPV